MRIPTKRTLPAATLVAITAILFALFSAFALFEYFQSRRDVLSLMRQEGAILLDALRAGGERAMLATEAMKQRIAFGLARDARFLEEMDGRRALEGRALADFTSLLGIDQAIILDKNGRAVKQAGSAGLPAGLDQFAAPVLSGKDSAVTGALRPGGTYAAAARRRRGGAVVAVLKDQSLAVFRREAGPGRLVREIGGRPGVAYVALQDTAGIVMASSGVRELSSIPSDPFLGRMAREGSSGSRVILFDERKVFEIAGSFVLENGEPGLFRIGLELDVYRRTGRNAFFRLAFIALAFVCAGAVGFGLLLAGQNVKLVSESFRRFRTHTGEILENLEDAVAAADGQGRVTVFNRAAAKLFRVEADSILGKPVDAGRASCFPFLLESWQTGKAVVQPRLECAVRGGTQVLFLRTSVVRGSSGNVDAVILVATDLTVQARLEEELRRSEKLKAMGELASGVAHEIRNPLNAVGMIAQRFLKEFSPKQDEDEYKNLARTVVGEVRRTNDIVKRFLRYASPPPLSLQPADAAPLLSETGNLFESGARAKGVEFSVSAEAATLPRLDADAMKRALLNLLSNALDATPAQGRIILRGLARANEYWIEVEDSGRGIPEPDRNRIYDLYFTTKPEGTGMGLPIVHQIVQGHGGKIDLESVTGRGSLFRVRLPMEGNT
jgi:signal transduction histidine kinase